MITYRAVMIVEGAEVSEGEGTSAKQAKTEAWNNAGEMDRTMADACGFSFEMHKESF